MAFGILHLLENDQEVIQRMTELLKPGGLFISSVPCLSEKMTLIAKLQFYPALLISRIGLIPQTLRRFTIPEVKKIIDTGTLRIIESEKIFHKLTAIFVVAKKI